MIDERRRHMAITSLQEQHGEEVAMAIAETLFSIEHATKEDLKAYPTKEDLKEALKVYATKEDLKQALKAYATKEDLEMALKALELRFDKKLAELELRIQAKLNKQLIQYGGITTAVVALATLASRVGT